jgi:hypothetical protein
MIKRFTIVLALLCGLAARAQAPAYITVTASSCLKTGESLIPSAKLTVQAVGANLQPVAFRIGGGGLQTLSSFGPWQIVNGTLQGSHQLPNPATAGIHIGYTFAIQDPVTLQTTPIPGADITTQGGTSFDLCQIDPGSYAAPSGVSYVYPMLAIGTVTTLSSGATPTVQIAGTPLHPLLNFGIPAGGTGSGTGATYTVSAPLALSVGNNISMLAANSVTDGYLSRTDWATFNGKQAALGYTPLNVASNLSDLASAATARTNLGLGTAATTAASAYDAAGAAAAAQAAAIAASDASGAAAAATATALQKSSNLSDLASAATARTNLGLGTAATTAASAYDAAGAAAAATTSALQKASNLSDLASAATARTNLGLGTAATTASTAYDASGAAAAATASALQKSNNLSDLASATTARTNLGLGTAATTAASAYDAAGAASAAQSAAIAASLQRASNLSDLASAATARTNLGLGTAATTAASAYDAAGAASAAQSAAIAAAAAGNAATASALDHTPTQCSTGNAPTGITAAGAATGCAALGGGGTANTQTAGTGGVTVNTFVSPDTSAPTKFITAATGSCGVGVALSTASASATFTLSGYDTTGGTVQVVADAGGITAGHLIVGSLTTAGDAGDSGQTSSLLISAETPVCGMALNTVAGGALVTMLPRSRGVFGHLYDKINGQAFPTSAAYVYSDGLAKPQAGTMGAGMTQTAGVLSSAIPVCADVSGSGTAQSCTTSPSFTPATGACIVYSTTTANTAAGLTINVNSLGAKSVAKWLGTTTLAAGDVPASKPVVGCYDGTNWNFSAIGNAPSGTGSAVGTYVSWNNQATVALSATSFYLPYSASTSTTENRVQFPVPFAGTMKNFYIWPSQTANAQSGTGNLVCDVRKNGATTGLTITFTAGTTYTTVQSDTTHTATVVAGDLMDMRCINSATVASMGIASASVVIQ